MLRGARYGGRPIYFSDVVVGADSEAQSFEDLRGRSFAVNERSSHSGYAVVRDRLIAMGETHGFFGRVVESGAHVTSIAMVAKGEVDASAIDSHVLALELRDHPELREQLRMIDALGPATIQPVVAANHVAAEVREQVREAFLGMADDEGARSCLELGLIERFVLADASSYDDIRAEVDRAEAAHFLVLK